MHIIAYVLNNDVRGGGSMPKAKPKAKTKTMHYNAKKCSR